MEKGNQIKEPLLQDLSNGNTAKSHVVAKGSDVDNSFVVINNYTAYESFTSIVCNSFCMIAVRLLNQSSKSYQIGLKRLNPAR